MLSNEFKIAIRFTILTTIVLGIFYPLVITTFAHLAFRRQADGELVVRNGRVIGSKLIGQSFLSDSYFHSRPSAAGNGYDATASGGTNFGPTNEHLLARIANDVAQYQAQDEAQPVPIDLVTASGSGLDSDISPDAALYQVRRVAKARKLPEERVRALVLAHIQGRQFGLLGEARVNVLDLNLALDRLAPQSGTLNASGQSR